MERFKKMVVVGPSPLFPETLERYRRDFADEIVLYPAIPADEAEMIKAVDDADAVLIAFRVNMPAAVVRACPNVRYIGMCCSLYNPESAPVDIPAANSLGMTVTGIRDYGDEGVAEYAVSELVQVLHHYRGYHWREKPRELTYQRIGLVGMGTVGHLLARTFRFFGADVRYFSRTRKGDIESEGVRYMPLRDMLSDVDICVCCLNKNSFVLFEEEFAAFGSGKILMNVAIGPCWDDAALEKWIGDSSNLLLSDTVAGAGGEKWLSRFNVRTAAETRSAGGSIQSTRRANDRISEQLEIYFGLK